MNSLKIELSAGQQITVAGRVRWALERLIEAGDRGVTPISQPGPRWSDYIFKLRAKGIVIETIPEAHAGPFAGRHGRYRLRSKIRVVHVGAEGERGGA